MKSKTEILEEATAQVILNFFKIRYPEMDFNESKFKVDEVTTDVVFIINNFLRISADIAREDFSNSSTAGEESWNK